MSNTPVDWPNVPEPMVRMIVEQGGKYLEWQFQASLAADQRATTSASIFTGFSAALLVGIIAYWAEYRDSAILVAGLVTAAMMLVGACVCFWAAKPRSFYPPGNEPAQWFKVVGDHIVVALGEEAENYQDNIDANHKVLEGIARLYIRGAFVACAAPVVGLIIWLIFFLLSADPDPVCGSSPVG